MKDSEEENMLEHMTEEEARKQILEMVGEYCDCFHTGPGEFREGMRIPYAGRVYDRTEMTYLVDAALEFWLTSGRYTVQFERELADFLKIRFASFVGSGSSANLLAFMTLTAPELKERQIQRGDEVITVAAGFPTTVTPMIQYGAVPVFVDVTIPYYNVDVNRLEAALSPKTKAVMLAHTLGNPFNLKAVTEFCRDHNLWLIEDNCDALGSVYELDGKEGFTGTFGDLGTSSFYPPHHMTTGEGGAVYTDNPLLYTLSRSFRDWGRDCRCASGEDNLCGHRYDGQFGELPAGYDHKYVYSHFGYNLKATDLQAAVGCAQLTKLKSFTEKRRANFDFLTGELEGLEGIILPKAEPCSKPSWFGYLITVNPESGTDRNRLVRFLEDRGIQTRMLFSGNLTRHPCFDQMRKSGEGYRISGDLEQTDRIMRDTFWIGVSPAMDEARLKYMADSIREGLKK